MLIDGNATSQGKQQRAAMWFKTGLNSNKQKDI